MKSAITIAAIGIVLGISVAQAEEELGVEQKVQRAYELYHIDELSTLDAGSWSTRLDFGYTVDSIGIPGLSSHSRVFRAEPSINYGFGNGYEVGVSLPFSYGTSDTYLGTQTIDSTRESEVGLPSLRLIKTFAAEDNAISLTGTIRPYREADNVEWQNGISVSVQRRMRPAFVSGNLGVEHNTGTDTTALTYGLGAGLSVNHDLTLGFTLDGRATENDDFVALGIRAAYQATPEFGVVVGPSFGITDSAPDMTIGLSLVRRW